MISTESPPVLLLRVKKSYSSIVLCGLLYYVVLKWFIVALDSLYEHGVCVCVFVSQEIGFTHMRIAEGNNSLLQLSGLLARMCRKVVPPAKSWSVPWFVRDSIVIVAWRDTGVVSFVGHNGWSVLVENRRRSSAVNEHVNVSFVLMLLVERPTAWNRAFGRWTAAFAVPSRIWHSSAADCDLRNSRSSSTTVLSCRIRGRFWGRRERNDKLKTKCVIGF